MPRWGRLEPPAAWPTTERLGKSGGSPTCLFIATAPSPNATATAAICWTFGRIYFFPLTRRGSTFDTKMEIFMETAGDTGFAPVDAMVGPDGDLFVAIGGRGTIGSVFRVKYTAARAGDLQSPTMGISSTQVGDYKSPAQQALREILSAPQPLASWSRAKWVPLAKELGKPAFEQAALNRNHDL